MDRIQGVPPERWGARTRSDKHDLALWSRYNANL